MHVIRGNRRNDFFVRCSTETEKSLTERRSVEKMLEKSLLVSTRSHEQAEQTIDREAAGSMNLTRRGSYSRHVPPSFPDGEWEGAR